MTPNFATGTFRINGQSSNRNQLQHQLLRWLRRRHDRSAPGEGRIHAINRDVQHGSHHIGERVDDNHERDEHWENCDCFC
jgi:hypothetical protein